MGECIDEPLRTYASGMTLRLAFPVATQCDPGILIVDEALGVGDSIFQQNCQHRIEALRAAGRTFLVVSHCPATVRSFRTRAIRPHHGIVVADGPAVEVTDAYERFMVNPNQSLPVGIIREAPPAAPIAVPARSGRAGRRPRR